MIILAIAIVVLTLPHTLLVIGSAPREYRRERQRGATVFEAVCAALCWPTDLLLSLKEQREEAEDDLEYSCGINHDEFTLPSDQEG